MMTSTVKGKSVGEAEELVDQFRQMTTGKLDPEGPESKLGRLKVFQNIANLPSRVKCAVLPWHTLHSAFAGEAEVSTEGSEDPVPGSGNDQSS
jgi:nitrogen fixation NifU-like protein